MKKIIFISIITVLACIAGCKSINDYCKADNKSNVKINQTTQQTQKSNFNSEIYVWEQFKFSTNRVNNVSK